MAKAIPRYARAENIYSSGFSISRTTMTQINAYIAMNEESIHKVQAGMDLFVRAMVIIARSEAMKRSFGPLAPNRRSSAALANRIPVQRITGKYYGDWYVLRLGNARWAVGNNSKESVLIETGMYQRTRRPILKYSVAGMFKILADMGAFQQFSAWITEPTHGAPIKLATPGLAGPVGRLPG
jgi:hypothetical protein